MLDWHVCFTHPVAVVGESDGDNEEDEDRDDGDHDHVRREQGCQEVFRQENRQLNIKQCTCTNNSTCRTKTTLELIHTQSNTKK